MSTHAADAEYKLVTILFADVVGSTKLGEGVDAETVRLILDRCLRRMSEAVDEFGGTVARLMGDGLLAFFGAPKAHEDDPDRAVLAALQIHRAVAAYAGELSLPLAVRVGVNTGRVVMGELGSEIFSEYTAMGQPVNLAARLQTAAEPGGSLLGETTARLVRHRFELQALEPLELKGFEEPVHAFRLVGARAEPEPSRGIRGLASPLVGRQSELDRLSEAVRGLEAGRGAIVSLIGEPGIGKSRLLQEVRELQRERNLRWAEGRAYSYSEDQPFSVIRDLLSELLGLSTDDTPAVLDLKLERSLTPLFGEGAGEPWSYLAKLVGAPVPPARAASVEELDAAALGRKIEGAFVQTVEALAGRTPTVVSFDDLHWADPTSLDLVRALLLSTERAPLLIVLLFRPERDKPVWELKTVAEREFGHRYLELNLSPLDGSASQNLIHNLLTISSLQPEFQALIQEKSEGNPFFLEELVRDLIDGGVLVREGDSWSVARDVSGLRVPETLQEVVQARLDRLPRSERATLQAASVLGRRFAFGLLEAIAPPDGDLSMRLLNLQRADLIRERARLPEPEYIFKHALVQEVTYDSLLGEQRKELHLQAGETLERLFSDRIEDNAAMIARHYDRAGDERALRFHRLAGDAAFRIYANMEAAEHYTAALKLARERPYDGELLEHLFLRRGRAFELESKYAQALETYEEMQALAQEMDKRSLRLSALLARLTLYVTPTPLFNARTAGEVADEALALGHELKDSAAEARILWNLSLLGRFLSGEDQGMQAGEQSLEIARRMGLREQTAYTLHDLFWSYLGLGRLAQARQAIEEARSIWEELGNLPLLADSYSSAIILHYLAGEFEVGLEASRKAWEISTRIENRWGQSFSKLYSPIILLERGEYDRAFEEMEACLALGHRAGFVVPRASIPAMKALAWSRLGSNEQGLELIAEALREHDRLNLVIRSFLLNVAAEICINMGNLSEAEERLREAAESTDTLPSAIFLYPHSLPLARLALAQAEWEKAHQLAEDLLSWLKELGSRPSMIDAYLLRGRAELGLGDLEQGRRSLRTGLDAAEELGSRRTIWEAAGLLSRAEAAAGNDREAARLRERAREVVAFIAEHAGSDDLRRSFLAREEVKEVMGE